MVNIAKISRCMYGRERNMMRLRTFVDGILRAPSNTCSEFCEHAAAREFRHIVKYSKILRHYHREDIHNER